MLLRRTRALVAVSLTWGMAWSAVGTCLNVLLVMATSGASLRDLLSTVPLVAISYAGLGAVCGACFALVTMYAERNRDLDQLSATRMALWGGLGGALLPLTCLIVVALSGGVVLGITIKIAPLLAVIAISGLFGGGFAAGQLRIARRLPSSAEATPFLGETTT